MPYSATDEGYSGNDYGCINYSCANSTGYPGFFTEPVIGANNISGTPKTQSIQWVRGRTAASLSAGSSLKRRHPPTYSLEMQSNGCPVSPGNDTSRAGPDNFTFTYGKGTKVSIFAPIYCIYNTSLEVFQTWQGSGSVSYTGGSGINSSVPLDASLYNLLVHNTGYYNYDYYYYDYYDAGGPADLLFGPSSGSYYYDYYYYYNDNYYNYGLYQYAPPTVTMESNINELAKYKAYTPLEIYSNGYYGYYYGGSCLNNNNNNYGNGGYYGYYNYYDYNLTYQPQGSSLQITAPSSCTTYTGYGIPVQLKFYHWAGSGPGNYTGNSSSGTVNIGKAPISEIAEYTTTGTLANYNITAGEYYGTQTSAYSVNCQNLGDYMGYGLEATLGVPYTIYPGGTPSYSDEQSVYSESIPTSCSLPNGGTLQLTEWDTNPTSAGGSKGTISTTASGSGPNAYAPYVSATAYYTVTQPFKVDVVGSTSEVPTYGEGYSTVTQPCTISDTGTQSYTETYADSSAAGYVASGQSIPLSAPSSCTGQDTADLNDLTNYNFADWAVQMPYGSEAYYSGKAIQNNGGRILSAALSFDGTPSSQLLLQDYWSQEDGISLLNSLAPTQQAPSTTLNLNNIANCDYYYDYGCGPSYLFGSSTDTISIAALFAPQPVNVLIVSFDAGLSNMGADKTLQAYEQVLKNQGLSAIYVPLDAQSTLDTYGENVQWKSSTVTFEISTDNPTALLPDEQFTYSFPQIWEADKDVINNLEFQLKPAVCHNTWRQQHNTDACCCNAGQRAPLL